MSTESTLTPATITSSVVGMTRMGTRQRVGYGVLSILFIFSLVLIDLFVGARAVQWNGSIADLLKRGSLLPCGVAALAALGALELTRLMQTCGVRTHARLAMTLSVCLVWAPWFSAAGWFGESPKAVEGLYWTIVILCIAVVSTAVLTVMQGQVTDVARVAGATLLVILYVGLAPSFAIYLRSGRSVSTHAGPWLLMMVVFITKAADIGGYLIGSRMGRHKLIPRISPGKSLEGTIGGVISSGLLGGAFACLGGWLSIMGWKLSWGGLSPITGGIASAGACLSNAFVESSTSGLGVRFLSGFGVGCILGVAGLFGDLFESCFKREAGAKDSGNVLPRYGGFLDLMDSPLLAMPVAWVLLTHPPLMD